MARAELVQEMADLYSRNYGNWSMHSPHNPGGQITLSPTRLKEWLKSADCKIALANHDTAQLVGYAIAIQTKVPEYGIVSWVTQFVVHRDHRHAGVGRSLLFSIWGLSDHYSWGLLTANPYAVRALEKATRRRCMPVRIMKNHKKMMSVGVEHVSYVTSDSKYKINKSESRINTEFYVDHSCLNAMLDSVTSKEKAWILGFLDEGWEWFAFTFHDQEQIGLTLLEIREMIEVSDQVVLQAYSRMVLDEKQQSWLKHSDTEAAFIISACGLKLGDRILDFGCGCGRHSLELAQRGFQVTAVDYVQGFIDAAQKNAKAKDVANVCFIRGDCRDITMNEQYDAVVCLYDVIGSYADDIENERILKNIANHLKPGGKALLSVMNLELTLKRAKNRFTLSSDPNRLLDLPASKTMETTGDIFNPDFYIIDTETNVVYRREQFSSGERLPEELIVRDRRYRIQELEAMCSKFGLKITWSRFVRSGKWSEALGSEDDHAKEILVFCEKTEG